MIELENVSLKFKLRGYGATGLKEACMRLLAPPNWQKKMPNDTDNFWALDDISLSIKDGERIGIIGNNGAGKSTLLKVIAEIYKPTLGKVRVNGSLASLIEVGSGFHPELTGEENVYLSAAISGISKATIQESYQAIVDFSELKDFMDVPVKYYSTGMYLRLAFTLATEVTPDILILDELYAGGDIAFIQKATVRLEQFIKRSKILVLVAHQMEYVEKFCNRVLILGKGKILFDGPPRLAIAEYEKLSGWVK